jgi:predicted transcriptional regulator
MGTMEGSPPLPAANEEDVRENIRALAARVAELEAKAAQQDQLSSLEFSDDKLAMIATSIYRSRQFRSRYFDSTLLGEPAWDMMLDAFIQKIRGRRVSTTSLCIAANVPQATGLRWLSALEKADLLYRTSAPDDARLRLVEITAQGHKLMRRFIADSVTRFEMPLPD